MERNILEGKAIAIIDRVRNGQPVEDDLFELKADWPDETKAARRIAGHANTARGAPITWLIGVCEKRGLVGVTNRESGQWWAGTRKNLGDVPPDLVHQINLPIDGKTVVILQWETDRAPYLWQNPSHGTSGNVILWEVPWREAATLRSANREDLLRILMPATSVPQFQLVNSRVRVGPSQPDTTKWWWVSDSDFYVQPRSRDIVVFTMHRTAMWLRTEQGSSVRFDTVRPSGVGHGLQRPTVEATYDQINIHGSALFGLVGNQETEQITDVIGRPLEFHLEMQPALSELAVKMSVVLDPAPVEGSVLGHWQLRRGARHVV